MACPIQSIIRNPNEIHNVPLEELRMALNCVSKEMQEIFFRTIRNKEWTETLSREQKRSTMVKKICLLLPEMSEDIFMRITNVSDPNQLLLSYQENREIYLAWLRETYCEEQNVEKVTDPVLFLHMIYCELKASHGFFKKPIVLFDECIKENISLTDKIDNTNLLEIGYTYGKFHHFEKIMKYYQERMEKHTLLELLKVHGKKIVENGFLASFMEVSERLNLDPAHYLINENWLLGFSNYKDDQDPELILSMLSSDSSDKIVGMTPDPDKYYQVVESIAQFLPTSERKKLYEMFGFGLILWSIERNDQTLLNDYREKFRGVEIDLQNILPRRSENELTYIEKFFLMSGKREECKTLVAFAKNTSGKKIAIPKSDQLFRDFNPEMARDEIEMLEGKIMEKLDGEDKSIWKNKEFLTFFHKYMETTFLETIFLFRDAWEKSNHDPKKMGVLLSDKEIKPNYYFRFFFKGFLKMYHFARGLALGEYKKGTWAQFPVLTPEDENPFFSPGEPQYHWRQMYLACRFLLHRYKLSINTHSSYFCWTWEDNFPVIRCDGIWRCYPDSLSAPKVWR